ncbi:MAG: response regulator transcription factor [Anaerolineaceae bacterium]|nr:response regulator transcription factor [Anaerolineaceae bacterium]
MATKLLIIDDEITLTKMIDKIFSPKGFEVISASNGPEGLRVAYNSHPDVIILDIMMPEMDGYEVCRRLRGMSDVPILLLTAKVLEEDLVRGFEAGADDYVKKPFSIKELEARVTSLLKRTTSRASEKTVYDDGKLRIGLEDQHVYRNGKLIHLTPTEFRLLSCLVKESGAVQAHAKLLTEVWGEGYMDDTACLSLYIRYLREKLEEDPSDPKYIRTQWGTRYWFAPVEQSRPGERN